MKRKGRGGGRVDEIFEKYYLLKKEFFLSCLVARELKLKVTPNKFQVR